MGKKNKNNLKPRDSSSYDRGKEHLSFKEPKRDRLIVLSLMNFDRNQGQSFEDWEEEKLLALAVSKLREVCNHTVPQATALQIIKPYSKVGFPPHSEFSHPKHVPDNVTWCSMHIQGKECIIGYFEDHIFHVVFLDKKHEFWITQKKHT